MTAHDNIHQVHRLREEQEKAINETDEKIGLLQKYKKDYEILQERLQTLPDQVSYDIMVPFGKLAFMPGKMVHTNEILVLLGDNWFAEKSAKESCETISRRMKVLDEQISDLQKQRDLLVPRYSFTSELEDIAQGTGPLREIREDYDPEKELLWREEHKKKVKAYNKERREQEKKIREQHEQKQKELKSDQELWDRLQELEDLESENQELERLDVQPEPLIDPTSLDENSEEESLSNDDDEDQIKTKIKWKDRPRKNVIHFKHTSEENVKSHSESDQQSSNHLAFNDPRDIYKHFIKNSELKSILKKDKKSNRKDTDHTPILKTKTSFVGTERSAPESKMAEGDHSISTAFTANVIEKNVQNIEGASAIDVTQNNEQSETLNTERPQKRVSKFKAQRMLRK